MNPTLLITVLVVLLLLTRTWSSGLDLTDNDDWNDFSSFPELSVKRMVRFQQLRKWLRAPLPESLLEWDHQWPTTYLDYGGKHPFENRELQSSTSSGNYQPIRISFITNQLESQVGQSSEIDNRIHYILNTILPEVEGIWSSHLRVVPTTGNIHINSSVCFGLFDGEIPNDILQNGVANTDLAIFVTAIDTITFSDGSTDVFCGPSDGKLAFAVLCSRDQHDRPAVGFINFCLNATTTVQGRRFQETDNNNGHRRTQGVDNQDEVLVALHEIGHVLGMSSNQFPYFRNSTTGEPLTPRPIANQTVTCIYGETQTLPFAAENTVQMGVTDKGITYYEVVTPRVRQVTRNHFNCQSLNGARLEDQDTSFVDCTGSHWDARLFFGELMEAKVLLGASEVLSPLTLALMEDTGWYKVNYGPSSLLSFGLNAGCDFVNGDCIVNDKVPDYGKGYFCDYTTPTLPDGTISNATNLFCDPTHYEWTLCALFDLQEVSPSFVQSLAPNLTDVRYFSNTNLAGLFPQGDYCPMPVIPVNVICTDTTTNIPTLYQGEQFGSTSRCIDAYFVDGQTGADYNYPGCFQVQCDATNFQVTVNGNVCSHDFQEITINTVSSTQATMICPRLSTLCPDLFCASDCSGRGICNYSTKPPTCQCFNASDSSPSCSAYNSSTVFPPSSPSSPSLSPPASGPTFTSSSLPPSALSAVIVKSMIAVFILSGL